MLPKSTERIGTSSAVKKDPHNHTQSSHSDEYSGLSSVQFSAIKVTQ